MKRRNQSSNQTYRIEKGKKRGNEKPGTSRHKTRPQVKKEEFFWDKLDSKSRWDDYLLGKTKANRLLNEKLGKNQTILYVLYFQW